MIPLPVPGTTDLLLLFLAAQKYNSTWIGASFAAWAVAGSLIGGYLTWGAGRKGGAAALNRHASHRLVDRITGWAERHGILFVAIAALLPPPIPLMPFLLAAGAFGVPRVQFLWSFGLARVLRYGVLAWLGVTYGHHIVRVWRQSVAGWSTTILWVYAGVVVLGLAYGVWKYTRKSAHAA